MFNKPFGAATFGSGGTPFGQPQTSGFTQSQRLFGAPAFGTSNPSSFLGTATQQTNPFTGASSFGQPLSNSFQANPSGGAVFSNGLQQQGGVFRVGSGPFGSGPASTNANYFTSFEKGDSSSMFNSSFRGSSSVPCGTTIKFVAPMGTDTLAKNGTSGTIHIRHQCIACMKEYENKSLEELQFEDYTANRKGPSPTTPFNQPSSLFGNSTLQQKASGFSFCSPATTSKSLFGTPSVVSPSFGNQGLFNSGVVQPQGTLNKPISFGSTQTSSFAFAAPKAPCFNNTMVNQTQPFGGSNLFGLSSTPSATAFGNNTGIFGASSAPKPINSQSSFFGQNLGSATPASASLNFNFGNSSLVQPATNIFGSKPTPSSSSVGNPLFDSNIFGEQNKNTSFFNPKLYGNSGFVSSGGLSNPQAPQLNAVANKVAYSFPSLPGYGLQYAGGESALTGLNANSSNFAIERLGSSGTNHHLIEQYIMSLNASPFGDSPLFRALVKDSKNYEDRLKPTNLGAQNQTLSSFSRMSSNKSNGFFKNTPSTKTKLKPSNVIQTQLFDGLEDRPIDMNQHFQPRRGFKDLHIFKNDNTQETPLDLNVKEDRPNRPPIRDDLEDVFVNIPNILAPSKTSTPKDDNTRNAKNASNENCAFISAITCLNDTIMDLNLKSPKKAQEEKCSPCKTTKKYLSIFTEDSSNKESIVQPQPPQQGLAPPYHPCGIVLTRYGYYTVPSLEELGRLTDKEGRCYVENFTIGRDTYGNVVFGDLIDVSGLNLDEIVFFRRKEIVLYPDDARKPDVGKGLNRKAQVTLDRVWPYDKKTRQAISDPAQLEALRYAEKIEKVTHKLGAKFVEYRPETGSWVFVVAHF